jgi:hypothetical protein
MLDPAERVLAAGEKALEAARKAGAELEFIPGYKLRGAGGRLLTDGILGYRDKKGVFRIVKVFEAKAGEGAAEKLFREAGRMSRRDWIELRGEAVEELRTRLLREGRHSQAERAAIRSMTRDQLRKAYQKRYRKIVKDLIQDEAGQARRTMERLSPNVSAIDEEEEVLAAAAAQGGSPTAARPWEDEEFAKILSDYEPMHVATGPTSTEIAGYVPSDVDTTSLEQGIRAAGLNFNAVKAGFTQDELLEMAQKLRDTAASVVAK